MRLINGGIPDIVESIVEGDWINCLANLNVLLHRLYMQLRMTYESVMVSFRAISILKGIFSDSFENTSFLLRLVDALEVNISLRLPIVNPQKDYEANQAWLALKRVRTASLERLGQLVYGINVQKLSAPSTL